VRIRGFDGEKKYGEATFRKRLKRLKIKLTGGYRGKTLTMPGGFGYARHELKNYPGNIGQ
jgi:hypothetical protein